MAEQGFEVRQNLGFGVSSSAKDECAEYETLEKVDFMRLGSLPVSLFLGPLLATAYGDLDTASFSA